MPRVKNIFSLNKAALLVTTSMVITSCSTTAQQDPSATATSQVEADKSHTNKPVTGLSQLRLMRIADRAWKKGDASTALRMYNMAAQKDPDNPAPYLAVAEILRKTKRAEAAIDVYNSVLRQKPESLEAQTGIAYSLLTLDKPYLAAESFETAIALEPDNPKSLGGMAVALDTAGEHDKAQDYYRLAIKAAPNNLTYQNNLALSLALVGRVEQAIAMLEIITAHPNATAKHRQNLALVYGMAGKTIEAMQYSRMDLSEKDARNNALYFQALNGPAAPDTPAQTQQQYAMAAQQKAQAAVPATTAPEAYSPLMARHETAELQTRSVPVIAKKKAPLSPQQPARRVQYAEAPKPANQVVAQIEGTDTLSTNRALAPVVAAQPEVQPAPAPVIAKTQPLAVQTKPVETIVASQPVMDSKIVHASHHPEALVIHMPFQSIDDDLEQVTVSVATVQKVAPQQVTFTTVSATTADHQYYAQVGAFKTEERALKAWKILKNRHSDLLTDYKPVFAKADLGPEKGGTFYRVRIGGFNEKSTPINLCASLRDRAQDCYMPIVSSKAETPTKEKIKPAPFYRSKNSEVFVMNDKPLLGPMAAPFLAPAQNAEEEPSFRYSTASIAY